MRSSYGSSPTTLDLPRISFFPPSHRCSATSDALGNVPGGAQEHGAVEERTDADYPAAGRLKLHFERAGKRQDEFVGPVIEADISAVVALGQVEPVQLDADRAGVFIVPVEQADDILSLLPAAGRKMPDLCESVFEQVHRPAAQAVVRHGSFETSSLSSGRPPSHSLAMFNCPLIAIHEPHARAWSSVRGSRSIRQSGSLCQTRL